MSSRRSFLCDTRVNQDVMTVVYKMAIARYKKKWKVFSMYPESRLVLRGLCTLTSTVYTVCMVHLEVILIWQFSNLDSIAKLNVHQHYVLIITCIVNNVHSILPCSPN